MALLTDAGGVMTDDTREGEVQPMPDVPDFARIIPISTIEQAQTQQQAQQWGQQQQARIADLWGHFAQDQLDQTVQRNTAMNWQPAQPAAYEPGPSPTPTPVPPTTDDKQGPRTGMEDASAADQPNVIQQFMSGLGGLVDRMKGGVSMDQAPADNSMPGGALGLGPHATAGAPMAPDAFQGGDLAADVLAPGAQARDATMAAPDGKGNYVNPLSGSTYTEDQHAQAVSQLTSGAMSGDMAAGKAGAAAVEGFNALRADLTADHPIVQAVVDASQQAGAKVNADAVARLIQSKGFDPENLAKASSRLTPTQTVAMAVYKAAEDPEVAQGVMKAAGTAPLASDESLPGPEIFDKTTPATPLPETPASSDPSLENLGKAGTVPPEAMTDQPPYTGAGDSKLAENPVVRAVNDVQGALKQAVLAGSVFHPLVESAQLGRTALAEGAPVAGAQGIAASVRAFASSGFAQRFAEQHAADIAEAEKAGMTMARIGGDVNPDVQQMGNRLARTLLSSTGSGIAGYASGKAQGLNDEDALKRGAIFAAGGAGVAQFAPALNAAMWGRMVPVAKLTAFNIMKDAYGPEVAATRANNIFGGQNLAKLGRNPEVQTILRTTFLAPDWLESWARNLGGVVKSGPEGAAARKWWAATGVSSALTLEGLNMAINGHGTTDNEPGRQLQLEVTPLLKAAGANPQQRVYADVLELGPLGSVLNAANRDGIGGVGANVATGHLNTLPGIGLDAMQNRSPVGGQIVSPGTPAAQAAIPELAAAAAHVAPIGVSSFEKSDLPLPASAVSAATGVRLSEGPAIKAKAAGPFAAAGGTAPRPGLSNLHSFLSGKAPAGPFGGASSRSGLSKLSSAVK